MDLLILVALGFALRSAYEHLRDDYRATRTQHLQKAAKAAPGGKLTKAQRSAAARRHATGYWAGEISRGFPVTRTGWHAGWLAHKTAAEHQRAVRDAAQTTHLETVASFAPGRAEQRRRQEALRREISDTLAAAPEGQRTGREAAQKAADEVAAKRAERQQQDIPAATGMLVRSRRSKAPDDTEGTCIHCGATDGRECEPGCPYRNQDWRTVARNTREHRRTRRPDGQPETDADRRFFDERESGYDGPLNQDGHRPDMSDPQQREAAEILGRMRQQQGDEPTSNGSTPATEGNPPVTADTNYTTVLQNAKAFAARADQDAAEARQRRMLAEQHAEEMQGAEVDPATLSSQMDLVDRLKAAEEAAVQTGEHASAVADGLQQRHGGLKQAHDDAPVRAAQRGFYEGD